MTIILGREIGAGCQEGDGRDLVCETSRAARGESMRARGLRRGLRMQCDDWEVEDFMGGAEWRFWHKRTLMELILCAGKFFCCFYRRVLYVIFLASIRRCFSIF